MAQHVTCRRYLAVRGRHEGQADALATGQPLVPLSPAGSGTRAWTGLLAILVTILASVLVLIILQRVRLVHQGAAGGTGPDPVRLPTAPAISASPRTLLPTVTAVPDPTQQPDLGLAVVDTGPGRDTLNLRQAPSRRADIIWTIGPGERLTLLEGPAEVDGETWWQVDYQGHTGWVAAAYVRRVPDASGRPSEAD